MIAAPSRCLSLLFILATITSATATSAVFPGAQWEEVAPESQGVNGAKLKDAAQLLARTAGKDGARELVIIRHGRMIWKGDDIDKQHGIWSATKSFTSTVLGLLIADGKCTLDTRVADALPEMKAHYPDVTLRHFTTMTSGYRAVGDETTGSYKHGPSKTPFVPNPQPLFKRPGTQYAYWDSAMNIFGLALTKIAGDPIEELFKRRVADPIGMKNWDWGDYATVDGVVVNGGSGNGSKHVLISAREMARFGLLFLNKGSWNGTQLVPESWITDATRIQVPATMPWAQPESEIDGRGVYGFNWWRNGVKPDGARKFPAAPEGMFWASGHNNNKCFVIPEWDMVIVRLGLDGKAKDEVWNAFFAKVREAVRDTRPEQPASSIKPRLLVLTDIGGDPDDQQSMIRLLVHANEFDIEGLVASASGTPGELKESVTKPQLIREQLDAYAKVLPNLRKHAAGFPDADALRGAVKSGNPHRGRDFIGEGHDTEGSRWIIACADKDDARPLNITIWGGQTDLAQALWRVRQDRGADGFAKFAARLRVFDIDDQDKIHDWLFAEFPDVFYVLSKAPKGADKRLGAYRGMYLGGDESLTSLAWLDEHVRKTHGPLGALYPSKTWTAPNRNSALKEGDTPSWFFFLATGLGDAAHPEWGGFGGRYVKESHGLFRDAKDTIGTVTDARLGVSRWRPVFQNEFAARMDWCVMDDFKKANHPPVAVLNGDTTRDIVTLAAKPGESLRLMANGSSDPDTHTLRPRWWRYREAGTYQGDVSLATTDSIDTTLAIPADAAGRTIHVILELTDSGSPALTRFRRAVLIVQP